MVGAWVSLVANETTPMSPCPPAGSAYPEAFGWAFLEL